MVNLLITLILVLGIIGIVMGISHWDAQIKNADKFCNLENFSIDKIHIIKRDPEYQKLINKLIDEKRFLFTDDELSVLKNKFQIYNVTENDIQNITKIIMLNCKNKLNTLTDNYVHTPEELSDVLFNINTNTEYTDILNKLKDDEEKFNDLDCSNTDFLNLNNQKNYYYDLFGNNIISDTKQYMANYYSTINSNSANFCVPVKTVPKAKPLASNTDDLPITAKPYYSNNFSTQPLDPKYTDFIIPTQYYNDINQTNLWNIDNERIINPYTIY
jgi:hypothetical protein